MPNLLPYVAKRTHHLLSLFESHAQRGTALELDETFMNLTMDVINFYLYGRSDLNYDLVGGQPNLKVRKKNRRDLTLYKLKPLSLE